MRDFKTDRASRWTKWNNYLRSLKGYAQKSSFGQISTFALFIGYPRSGHTLIGSLLDAHPNMVIAHEMDVLYHFQKGYTVPQIYYLMKENAKAFTESGRKWMGYNYHIPGQWQGKHDTIQLIGDKSGGRTTRRLQLPSNVQLLKQIEEKTGTTIVFIHVIRNPFDIITTMMKRSSSRRDSIPTSEQLDLKVRHFFKHVDSVEQLKEADKFRIIDVYHEDFVANPRKSLRSICKALAIATTDQYIESCAALVWNKARLSRNTTDLWSEKRIAAIENKIKGYDFLKRYTFEAV